MNSNDENKERDCAVQIQKLLDHSQDYLNRLPLLKNQLHDIDHVKQRDLYSEKLNEIDKIIQNLTKHIHNIEQFYSQLNENERLKFDQQINLFRLEVDRQMSFLHSLHEQFLTEGHITRTTTTTDEIDNNETNFEENLIPDGLRQRRVTTTTTTDLNDPYDLLEQDLARLHETMDEVAALIARQEEQQRQLLTKTQYIKNMAQSQIHNATSFIQKALYNRYVTVASGAILGASIGGPVGLTMGTKVGALVAVTGSAVGALSMSIMQQRATEDADAENNNTIAYNQAML